MAVNHVNIPRGAVQSLGFVWDIGLIEWVPEAQPATTGGGGGGGGPVTVANGADVTQGSIADAAWVSGSGTVISLLKKIASAGGSAVSIADGSDVAQGTTTDAASASTVIGLLKNLKAALAGSLTVTNTNLDVALSTRTKPADQQHTIIDSGTTVVTQATGTNLHVVVDSAPSTAVTGPLTDTQLRATAVPVSGTVTTLPPANATTDVAKFGGTSVTIGQQLAAASIPVILPSATVTTLTPPAAIAGFALEAGHLSTIDSVQGTQGDTAWVSGNGTVVALLKKIASAGGSAVSVADGADVAQGSVADSAWVSGSGTVISLLKKIASAGGSAVSIADGADTAQGTTTDLASASTVIGLLKNLKAALAGTLTVAGTVTANAGTNLNTSALALDATLTGGTQQAKITDGTNVSTVKAASTLPAATDKALVVTLRESLSTPVTGPLTDTQLRASAVPVSLASAPTTAVTNAGLTNLDVALSTRTKPADQQHTIIDSGTTTVTQTTGTNLHVVVDSAPTTAVTGTFFQVTQPVSGTVTTTPPANASTNIAQVNGVTTLTGTGATGTGAQRVTIATDSATVAGSASLPAGTNVIGHVINDTGSTTAVTGNVTVVQATGTALHAVLDTTSTTAVTQATGTNLHTVIDSGTLTTVSTVTAVTAITNALPTGTNTLGSVKITDGTTVAKITVANAQPASTDGAQLVNSIDTFAGTALASASRGVATVNTDIVNYNGKGIRVWQDLTVLGASSVCTFTVQEKDPTSGKFLTILASAATGAGINATGTAKITVYPGLTAAANSVASDVVPFNIRIVSTVATAASTFSIGYALIP